MASFVLQRCKLRQTRLVPAKEPPFEVDWKRLAERLAPSNKIRALEQLRMVRAGCFVGLTRHPQANEPCNFVLQSPNRTGRIEWLLKRDPTFADRLLEVFRVESVVLDDRIEELAREAAA